MGKSTISMAIFNSKLLVYQRVIPKANRLGIQIVARQRVARHVFAETRETSQAEPGPKSGAFLRGKQYGQTKVCMHTYIYLYVHT